MGGIVQERYTPILLGANTTTVINNSSVGGFLCKTAGTITINGASGSIIVDTHPVTAGVYIPMPFHLGGGSGVVVLAGGASGTLAVV